MDLKESALLGEQAGIHWYYRSKAAAMMRCLEGHQAHHVLDVGAGSGFFSRHLLEHSDARSACCVDIGYATDWDESAAGKPLRFRRAIDRDAADLVLLMDVLEHVDDDEALLVSCASQARIDALVLLTVPAHQWLWSSHDVFLEHRRRYTLKQLESVVNKAGLQVMRLHYYFALVLPVAAALRLVERVLPHNGTAPRSQLRHHGQAANSLLTKVCRAELSFMHLNRVMGLSLFCLARKVG